jgi:hypothetical protein
VMTVKTAWKTRRLKIVCQRPESTVNVTIRMNNAPLSLNLEVIDQLVGLQMKVRYKSWTLLYGPAFCIPTVLFCRLLSKDVQ